MVAKKLLKPTKVQVDTADSGEKALELTLLNEYHLILMDHLMPKMDGIECFHAIRAQSGGLSKETSVVVLTANAGADNQAMYKREGFDAYLVKPVDSVELENTMRKVLPDKLVKLSREVKESDDAEGFYHEIRRKTPIVITTESSADLPPEIIHKLGIPVIPFKVHINDGIFYDGEETGNDTIVRCIQDKEILAKSEAPSVAEYENFFSEQLTHAQHIIHISSAKAISNGFANACEGALAFYNVRVLDSGLISSGLGLLVLYAKELTEIGMFDPDQIISALEDKKVTISTSYIINNTEFLYRSGKLSNNIHKVCDAFMFHPMVEAKNSQLCIRRLWAGNFEKTATRYIKEQFKHSVSIDTSKLFITYSGLKHTDIEKIISEINTYIQFEKVYVQKASPSVSINCGPNTFGLFYMRKNDG
jgi:DegV family protein with EDD domain